MSRGREVAQSALSAMGSRPSLVDGVVSGLLSATALVLYVSNSSRSDLAIPAVVCALASTTTVAWRNRAPEAAVVVAGAGAAGYEWFSGTHSLQALDLLAGMAVLLAMYTAGVRGISHRQIAQLAALVSYGIAVSAVAAAATGSLSVSSVVEYALPLAVAPAAAGLLVARQRSLTARLAATTARLRAEEEMRLALVTEGERNRVARELHDVVAHAVSVMVVQAGAARITVIAEPNLARTALGEVARAGRAAIAELSRIMGLVIGAHDRSGPPFGIDGLITLVEHRRVGGLGVEISVTGSDPGLASAVDSTLYRLVQEALTNIVKHAPSAEAKVNVAIEPGAVDVLVRNSPPQGPTGAIALAGSGQGLIGMRARVESCGGQLSYGPQPDGGFEVRARIPFTVACEEPSYSLGRRPRALMARIRRLGPWPGVVTAMCVLGADAFASPDPRESLPLNTALAVCMALPLIWRRQSPLLFLVAVNLLALPISNGFDSANSLFWVSTYVLAVPVWAVAAWSESGPAVAGLILAAAFTLGEGLHWHWGGTSIVADLLFTGLLWVVGRVVRSQRLLAADLERTHSRLEAEQRARELLKLAAERTRMVGELHSLVAEQVSAMIVAADSTRNVIGVDSAVSVASISAIEQTGREALARLREILGLLRAEHDPDQLSPLLGVEHLHDLIARYRGPPTSTKLDVGGDPGPLLGGIDLLVYRLVEEVLAAAGHAAPCSSVGLLFSKDRLFLDFVLDRPLRTWADLYTPHQVERLGGTISRSVAATGERITVEVPLTQAMVSQ